MFFQSTRLEWTNTSSLKLIELFREQECLWNTLHPAYKNKNRRFMAWRNISNVMGVEVSDLKKKMESLMTSFRRERLRVQSGKEESYSSTWFAYDSMNFLLDKGTNIKAEQKRKNEERAEEKETRKENEETEESDVEVSEPQPKVIRTVQRKFDVPKRRTLYVSHLNPSINNDSANHMRSFNNKREYEKDEFSLFGEQIALKLRKITSPYARFTVQNMINKVLFDAEVGKFNNPADVESFPRSAPTSGLLEPSYHSNRNSFSSIKNSSRIMISPSIDEFDSTLLKEQRPCESNLDIEIENSINEADITNEMIFIKSE